MQTAPLQYVFSAVLKNVFVMQSSFGIDHIENSFSPICILLCLNRTPLCRKLFPQVSHENSFSPGCILWRLNKKLFTIKLFLQWSHENSFSPGCYLWWLNRKLFTLKLFVHSTMIKCKWPLPIICYLIY